MNIKELHPKDKPVSAISFFKSELGNATAIQILKGEKNGQTNTKIRDYRYIKINTIR